MKKNVLFPLMTVILMSFATSCEFVDDLINITFETNWVDIDFTLNPQVAGEKAETETVLQSDIEAEIEEHGGNVESLDEIRPYEAILTIVTEGITFNAFEWIEVYVGTADVAERLIASATISELGLLKIDLDVSDSDLMDIIDAEEYMVRVVGFLNEDLPDPVDMVLQIKYQVVV